MDKFEKIIKQTVEHYEVPYSEDAWKSLSKKMGPERGATTNWILGISAAVICVCGALWFMNSPADISNESTNQYAELNQNEQTTKTISNTENSDETAHEEVVGSDHSVEAVQENINPPEKENSISTATPSSNHSETDNQTNNDQSLQNLTPANNNIEPINIMTNNVDSPNPQTPQQESDLVIEHEKADFSHLDLNVVADQEQICYGKSIAFTPSVPKIKAIYQWDMGDGTITESNFMDHTYSKPGIYHVKLRLLDIHTKEIVKVSPAKEITIHALPDNHITHYMENNIIPTAFFSQNIEEGEKITWEIEDLHRSYAKEFAYEFKKKGTYQVKCTIINEFGCSSTKTDHIKINHDYNLLAPSSFTPNGDGINETFIPKALLVSELPFTMTIYDKSGKLVYQTTDANSPWDGLYTKDLRKAPEGSYVWNVVIEHTNAAPERYQGTVTLLK